MQLERREAIELCIVIQSLVAIGSSNEAFDLVPVSGTGSESKTNEVEKSYKRSGALNQKHRGGKSCDSEEL
jgi:hypothetical protein